MSAHQPADPASEDADADAEQRAERERPDASRRADLAFEALEPRIMMSATWVDADTGEQHVDATDGNDVYTGSDLADIAHGDGGHDQLLGGAGDDQLFGDEGDDVLRGGSGNDALHGGEGTDTADYSQAASGVSVDLTVGTADGGDGHDTLTQVESVVGSQHADVFSFATPVAGQTYTVDGHGGSDRIDLSQYSSADVSFGAGSLTIDMGSGQSFSVAYDEIDSIRFADVSATVLSESHSASAFTGTGLFIEGDEAFQVRVGGSGSINFNYDAATDTFNVSDVNGMSTSSTLSISDLNGSDLNVGEIKVDQHIGALESNVDIGAISIANHRGIDSITVAGDHGAIGSLTYAGDVDFDAAIHASVANMTIGQDLEGGHTLTIHGNVDALHVAKEIEGALDVRGDLAHADFARLDTGASLTVQGDAGDLAVSGDIDGALRIGGTLSSLTATNVAAHAVIEIGGDVGSIATTRDILADITIHGDLASLSAEDVGKEALIVIDGDAGSVAVVKDFSGDLTVGGDLAAWSAQNFKATASIQVSADAGSLTVGASLSGSITIGGTLDSLSVASSLSDGAKVEVSGDVSTITIRGGMSGTIRAHADLGTLHVTGNVGKTADLQVEGRLDSLAIDGQLAKDLTFSESVGSISLGKASSKSITVAGDLDTFTSTGNYSGTLTVKNVIGSFTLVDQSYTFSKTYEQWTSIRYDGKTLHEVANAAAIIDAGSDQVVSEGDAVSLSGSATDPEGRALTYTWMQSGGPAVVLDDPHATNPTFTAPEGVSNSDVTFELHVSDGTNTSVDTVTITVNADDDAPSADAGPTQVVEEGDVVSLSGSATDPEGRPLTYTWMQSGGPAVVLDDPHATNPMFTAPEGVSNSDVTFELHVSDGTNTSVDTVTITVNADDDAPSADAGPTQVVEEGDLVTLSGSATDPEGRALTYTWMQSGGPAVVLDDPHATNPTFTAPEGVSNSDVTFELHVSDGTNTSVDTVTITVNADDDAPSADAGPTQVVEEGFVVTLSGSGSDVEGQALTYEWVQTNGPHVVLSDPFSASPSFTAPEGLSNTDIRFELRVSDGNSTSIDSVTVTIERDDDAPTAIAGEAQLVDEGEVVQLSGSAHDPEGAQLTYTWTQVGGPPVELSDPHAANPTFSVPLGVDSAQIRFQLSVSDGENTSIDTVAVVIRAPASEHEDPNSARLVEDASSSEPEPTLDASHPEVEIPADDEPVEQASIEAAAAEFPDLSHLFADVAAFQDELDRPEARALLDFAVASEQRTFDEVYQKVPLLQGAARAEQADASALTARSVAQPDSSVRAATATPHPHETSEATPNPESVGVFASLWSMLRGAVGATSALDEPVTKAADASNKHKRT